MIKIPILSGLLFKIMRKGKSCFPAKSSKQKFEMVFHKREFDTVAKQLHVYCTVYSTEYIHVLVSYLSWPPLQSG